MHDIFISYSTKDQLQAEAVRDILENNGIACWMAPRDIPGGSNYTKEIPSAIRGCSVFVLILSQNSQNSPWVLKELDSAVNCGKVVLPFMLEDFQLSDEFNFLLTGAQRYAAYQKKAEALESLINRIRAIIGNKEETPVVSQPATVPSAPVQAASATAYYGFSKCPACGGSDLEEWKKIGRFTLQEKLSWLLIPVCGIAGGIILALLGFLLLAFTKMEYTLTLTVTSIAIILGLSVGCWLGSRFSREWIRRQRVRRHVRTYPLRCKACRRVFLPTEH